jgi:hypothetical protein
MKRKTIIILVATLAILWVAWNINWIFRTGDVYTPGNDNEANRSALLSIRDKLALQATHSDVLNEYWKHKTDDLRISAENPTLWFIQTPLELGAGNWIGRIEFSNAVMTAFRIRTDDGPKPEDGPEDKELESPTRQ